MGAVIPATVAPSAAPKRQTVLSAAVDSNGFPNYITAGSGRSVNIAATAVPVVLTAANGFDTRGQRDRIAVVSADTTIASLTASSTCYLYADIDAGLSVTFGHTTVAPAYQHGGTYSTTNGAFTFNISEMVGKVGNGSTATQTYRVFIGEAVTSGSAVTSVVNYALQGRYRSADTSLGAISTAKQFAHNIGVMEVNARAWLKCNSASLGYTAGQMAEMMNYVTAGWQTFMPTQRIDRNTCQYVSGAGGTGGLVIQHPSTGTIQDVTPLASWRAVMVAERTW